MPRLVGACTRRYCVWPGVALVLVRMGEFISPPKRTRRGDILVKNCQYNLVLDDFVNAAGFVVRDV
jgi:hypothetical protein